MDVSFVPARYTALVYTYSHLHATAAVIIVLVILDLLMTRQFTLWDSKSTSYL